jgi:Flp pilus assembly protein CpaB
VAFAALGVFVAARGAGRTSSHSYVVVAHDVTEGTTLAPSDVTTATMDLPDDVAGRSYTDVGSVVGRIAVAHLGAGELVQASTVVGGDAADSRVELSIPVERARAVDGLLLPGERVDILATFGSGTDGQTLVVTRDAEIRRVDNGSRGALGGGDTSVIVLAVPDPDAALAVTHASQAGKVTVVRSTGVQDHGGASSYQPPSASATGDVRGTG